MREPFKSIGIWSMGMVLLSSVGFSDEISDTIEGALSAYKQGKISVAKEDLAYALELLKQKKGERMKAYLPNALQGWQAGEATSKTAGAGMLGGGTTLSRTYTKGKAKVLIEIVVDSPLIAGLGSMFTNPMFASGGKLKRIKREKAMVNYDQHTACGEITLMIDNRFMVTIKGEHLQEKALLAYAQAIDFDALKKI